MQQEIQIKCHQCALDLHVCIFLQDTPICVFNTCVCMTAYDIIGHTGRSYL